MARQQRTTRNRSTAPGGACADGANLAQHPDRWIGVKELAQLLGVPPRSVYSGSAEAAELRAYAITFGKHLRWRFSFVLDWMRSKEAAQVQQANHKRQQQQRRAANVVNFPGKGKPKTAQAAPASDLQSKVQRKREQLRRQGLLPA